MVIVYRYLCEKARLLCILIVFGVILNAGYGRCLEVCRDGELKGAVFVSLYSTVTVIEISLKLYCISGVILKVMLGCVKLYLYVCGIDRAAVTVGFTYVIFGLFKDDLACRIVGYRDDDLFRVTEKSRPYESQRVDSSVII